MFRFKVGYNDLEVVKYFEILLSVCFRADVRRDFAF
jgi:hypothetical protein